MDELTDYQRYLFSMLVSDMTMAEIRGCTNRNTWVLAGTITRIYRKLGVKNRRELKRIYNDGE